MPGAKHSSLKALSPANYGSVRRKRSQRLRDPSDPSLNVPRRKQGSTPTSRGRRLLEKASAPTPILCMGPRSSLLPGCGFPSRWISELTCVPSRGGCPCSSSLVDRAGTFSSFNRWVRWRTCWKSLCYQGLASCLLFICRPTGTTCSDNYF